ncbi:MAG TPA: hypothetical protein VF179_10685 [Thermoanaerobaculia bacterium]|nr:hypothetical protein [Thermoanaerobaculia bacterium]
MRATGQPQQVTARFEILLAAPHYRLQVGNGRPDGSSRISSAWVRLNGREVFGPSDFNQQVGALQRFVDLRPVNEIQVGLAGAPGGRLTVEALALVGAGGGTVATTGGTHLTVPPGAVDTYVEIGLEEKTVGELPLALPAGYAFLGAVAVDVGNVVLSSEADLEIPAPDGLQGPVIVARIVNLEGMWRLVLVDTASLTPEGRLKTDSPPFPGVRASGDYVFLTLPDDVGIVGAHVRTLIGEPVEGAALAVLRTLPGAPIVSGAVQQAVAGDGGFVGLADATGFAAVPGVPAHSEVTVVAIDPGRSGPAQAGLVQFSVGNVLANGLMGNWLQNVIVHQLFDLDDIPDAPAPCPCVALSPVPAKIPDSGGVFLPGETRDLKVDCGGEDVTISTDLPSVGLQLLTTGLAVVDTRYAPKDPDVVTVSESSSSGKAIVTARQRGTTSIVIDTKLSRLFKVGSLLQVQTCSAAGIVKPVDVDCPAGLTWDAALQLCRRPRLSVQRVGSLADDGIVISVLDGRIDCGSACQAEFDHGESVILGAGPLPDTDADFIEWGGDCSSCGTSSACPIQIQTDTTCTARFECSAAPSGSVTLTASRDAGPSSIPVPSCGKTIRIVVIVPNNMISGSGTTGNCGRGDNRVGIRVCPPNAGCTGFTVQAGQGQGLDICHAFDQILGPYEILNPRRRGTSLVFEAVTEKLSSATIEFQ